MARDVAQTISPPPVTGLTLILKTYAWARTQRVYFPSCGVFPPSRLLTRLDQHHLVPSILILSKFRYLAAVHEADTSSSDEASLTLDPEPITESMVVDSSRPGSGEGL
ncbi:hypothetical protein R3P38DRAFT_3175820 [Favolaschia claudopus]|uniref:Uncharacterized protein n=1 Tax=Favolaschia claudopus TaxID=2862362 RepID=A0AAW0D672_9AGAR